MTVRSPNFLLSYVCLAGLGLVATGDAFAQNKSRGSTNTAFRPVAEAPPEGPRTGQGGSWNLSVAFSSTVPFSSPYELSGTGIPSTKFRFQLPVTAAVGILYGWSDGFDVGVEAGIESFGTKIEIAPGDPDLQIAEFTAYPIKLLLRYRFEQSQTITPEIEMGAGYAFGKARVSSTIVGSKVFEESIGYVTGHLAGGAAVAWNDETTLHAQAGAAYSALGAKKFNDTATAAATSQSAIFGLFFRAGFTYRF